MSNFTREQKIAQSADRHLAVTAGAGAGKTSVLVQRFVYLLFDDVIRADVRSITAITFTRKAAAEMHHRISQEIEKRLANPDYKPQWGRIKAVRERFSSANISTIHSFCARLLREFPIEAGVNPNFTEIEEHEGAQMKEHAIMETLEEWLEEKTEAPSKGKREAQKVEAEPSAKQLDARRVWMLFGKKELVEMLKTLLGSAEQFHELEELYRRHDIDSLLQMTEKIFVQRFFKTADEYCSTLDGALRALDFSAFSKTTLPKLEALDSTLGVLRHQLASLQDLAPEPANERANLALNTQRPALSPEGTWRTAEEFWNRFCSAMFESGLVSKSTGTISGTSVSKKSEKNFVDRERYLHLNYEANALFLEMAAMAGVMPHYTHDRAMLEIIHILLALAADAWKLVREEKERLGALDFDDLELKVDKLLDNDDVCARIRMKTRFLMIDEFQDTNELQYRLAKKIIGRLGEPPSPEEEISASGTNLFIVGDPKQSIYRFRGADVRVFAKAKRDIEALNSRLLSAGQIAPDFRTPKGNVAAMTDTEKAGNIGLRATFRLLPEIAAFVNCVCGDQLRRTTTDFDVEYDDIVCGVSSSEVQGTVKMLLARYPSKKTSSSAEQAAFTENEVETEDEDVAGDESFVSDAQLLAEYLRAVAEGTTAEPVMVRSSDGSPRRAAYSDMMILIRSRSGVDSLLAALRRCNVPFLVVGGRGFYERQEILDIRSFLLFLQNANDDIALAALLRSPFFAVTDTELYAISRTEVSVKDGSSINSLWERFGEFYSAGATDAATSGSASPNAHRAYTTLTNLLPLAAQLSIPTLIRTILEQTAWRAMIAADERFDQIEANLEKLLVIARKYENKGFRNLYDFAEELRRLALYAFNEGEADSGATKNAVQIMTIHGAKGLEAPIVAVYNTNARAGGFGGGLSFDTALGMSFKMLRAREDGTMEHLSTPLYYMASEKDRLADEAELKRLLYVALTRAKDHLVIAGKAHETSRGDMKKPEGLLRMMVESLSAEGLNLLHEPSIPLPKQTLDILSGEELSQREVQFPITILRAREQFLADSALSASNPAQNITADDDAHSKSSTSVTTVSADNSVFTGIPPLLLGTLSTTIEGDFYSASQLQLFRRNPEEYERLYRLGLPPADDDGYFTGRAAGIDDDGDETLGTTAGESIHAVLQHLPSWMGLDGTVQPSEFQRTIERILPSTRRVFTPALHARIQRETQAVASAPLVRRYAPVLLSAQYEYPITMPLGADFLIGTIDALIKTPTGELEIWDWKTNRVGSARDMDKLLSEYRLQLEVYAFVASRLQPEQDVFTTRLLFTRRATQNAHDDEWTRTLEFTRLDVASIEEKIHGVIGEIRAVSYGLVLQ